MVKLDVIYTRGGDKGETSLGDGSRISKTALRVESYGTVDEANAAIGLCRLHTDGDADTTLARIQNELFDLGADLATPEKEETRSRLRIDEAYVTRLESEIDSMTADLAPLTSFILPGGSPASAHLHMARNIVRRAERLAIALAATETVNPVTIRYLNRLSDHLFSLGRWLNDKGRADVLWVPGGSR